MDAKYIQDLEEKLVSFKKIISSTKMLSSQVAPVITKICFITLVAEPEGYSAVTHNVNIHKKIKISHTEKKKEYLDLNCFTDEQEALYKELASRATSIDIESMSYQHSLTLILSEILHANNKKELFYQIGIYGVHVLQEDI